MEFLWNISISQLSSTVLSDLLLSLISKERTRPLSHQERQVYTYLVSFLSARDYSYYLSKIMKDSKKSKPTQAEMRLARKLLNKWREDVVHISNALLNDYEQSGFPPSYFDDTKLMKAYCVIVLDLANSTSSEYKCLKNYMIYKNLLAQAKLSGDKKLISRLISKVCYCKSKLVTLGLWVSCKSSLL